MNIRPIKETGPFSRVLHVTVKDSWDLAMTFLRMQEWYESPKFHHKHFTLEAYMRWYQKAYGKGTFSYPKDWTGFNVPSTAVLAIMNGPSVRGTGRDPAPNYDWENRWLNAESDLFLQLCRTRVPDWGPPLIQEPDPIRRGKNWCKYTTLSPFYLIGTTEVFDEETLDHEIAHGRFFVDAAYRRKVLACLRRHNTSGLETFLLKKGYSKWTLKDEVHAYALTGWPERFETNADLRKMHFELTNIAGKEQP